VDDPWQGKPAAPTNLATIPTGPAVPQLRQQILPHRILSHALNTVGEFGYGIDTTAAGLPTLKFWDNRTTPPFRYAPVLDFFCYNPISSAYPRAGIVISTRGMYTVLAAILALTYEKKSRTYSWSVFRRLWFRRPTP